MTAIDHPNILQVGSVIAFIYEREAATRAPRSINYKSWKAVKKDFVRTETKAKSWANGVFVGALEIVRM